MAVAMLLRGLVCAANPFFPINNDDMRAESSGLRKV